MSAFANILPSAQTGGLAYTVGVAVPAVEADLGQPVALVYGHAISATVEFAIASSVASQSSYVVMQTDWGDGNWVDVAWCNYSGLTPATFTLSATADEETGSFQQTRVAGTTPSPTNSSNPINLGGRIRFVAAGTHSFGSSSSSSSSSSSGVPPVAVTVRYRFQATR